MNVEFRRNGYKNHCKYSQFDYIRQESNQGDFLSQEQMTKKSVTLVSHSVLDIFSLIRSHL